MVHSYRGFRGSIPRPPRAKRDKRHHAFFIPYCVLRIDSWVRLIHKQKLLIRNQLIIMTEDEKKEFEEFLQWKKEKQKKLSQEQQQPEKQVFHSEELEESQEEEPEPFYDSTQVVKKKADSPQNLSQNKNTTTDKIMIAIGLILIACFISSLVWKHNLQDDKKNTNKTDNNYEVVDSFNLLQEKRDSIIQAKADSAKASADSIRKAKRIDFLRHSVHITTARLSSPNSAAGVDAIIYYKNLSNKTIKYFIWKGYAKNAVGDIVENEIGGNVSFSGKDTGPIRPGKTGGGCWDCIIYNWTAKKLVMTSVTIEYMDGTELKISEKEIKYIR